MVTTLKERETANDTWRPVYRGLQEFLRDVFTYGVADRLLLDSPTVDKAIYISAAVPEGVNVDFPLHGTTVRRWMQPFGTLLIPSSTPTQELLAATKPESILRESDYPKETAALAKCLEGAP